MTDGHGAPKRRQISEAELAWVAAHLPSLRREVAGKRIFYRVLIICMGLGLVAHIAGYLVEIGNPEGLVGLVADLVRAFGVALWTGVVLVFFLDVLPAQQQGTAVRMLQEYEAALRDRGRSADPGPQAGDGPE